MILHAGSGLRNLSWVISKDAAAILPAIKSMIRGVLTRPSVRAALRRMGITVKRGRADPERALSVGSSSSSSVSR